VKVKNIPTTGAGVIVGGSGADGLRGGTPDEGATAVGCALDCLTKSNRRQH